MRSRVLVCSFVIVCATGLIAAQEQEVKAEEVLKKMRAAYSSLKAYSDSGNLTTEMTMGGQTVILEKPFSIAYESPDSIRFDWVATFGGIKASHVLVSSKDGVFTYNKLLNQVILGTSLKEAIDQWSGVSGGSVRRVPCMLLPIMQNEEFSALTDLEVSEVEELIEKEHCCKISGKLSKNPVVLWICKKDSLLRKVMISTPLGKVVEVHEDIKVDADVEKGASRSVRPKDAKEVNRFDYKGVNN